VTREANGGSRHMGTAMCLGEAAGIYAALGNKDEALAWLKRACDEHEQGVLELKTDPRFDTLRSDPRFTDLLRSVKLAP